MWRWDQGHLPYFNFDATKKLAVAAITTDLISASKQKMRETTGLTFSAPSTHSPWRNYARVFKLCLLTDAEAKPTSLAHRLAEPGSIEGDQYFHFLARAFAVPSPAFQHYDNTQLPRWPLLFSLKMLLAHAATGLATPLSSEDIIAAFDHKNATGEEDLAYFSALLSDLGRILSFPAARDFRQSRESLSVLSQISYLSLSEGRFLVGLSPDVARDLFLAMKPVGGVRLASPSAELMRLADAFDSSSEVAFSPPEIESDLAVFFPEGARKFRTHLYLERNRNIRRLFFNRTPRAACDVCSVNTQETYKLDGLLDLHHLLPLSSGSRVDGQGTMLNDLVPVCPTCHRAVHKFYSAWLRGNTQQDFNGIEEARSVYTAAKNSFRTGHRNA